MGVQTEIPSTRLTLMLRFVPRQLVSCGSKSRYYANVHPITWTAANPARGGDPACPGYDVVLGQDYFQFLCSIKSSINEICFSAVSAWMGQHYGFFEGTPRLHGGPHWHLDLDHIIGGQRARTRMLTIEPLMLRACGHDMGVFFWIWNKWPLNSWMLQRSSLKFEFHENFVRQQFLKSLTSANTEIIIPPKKKGTCKLCPFSVGPGHLIREPGVSRFVSASRVSINFTYMCSN